MARHSTVAGAIALAALLAGWLFLQAMSLRADPASQPYVETLSFALSTPAGLVFLAYLATAFSVEEYFGGRGPAGLFGDFFLSVLAAAAVGLPVTAGIVALSPSRTLLFVVASFGTFLGGFVTFYLRTRSYFEWEDAAEE